MSRYGQEGRSSLAAKLTVIVGLILLNLALAETAMAGKTGPQDQCCAPYSRASCGPITGISSDNCRQADGAVCGPDLSASRLAIALPRALCAYPPRVSKYQPA